MSNHARLLGRFPRERTWLLPALQALQHADGYLSLEALEAAAAHLRVPKSEVYGVATHYPDLRLTRPGKRLVRVCTGASCRILGSRDLLSALERLRDRGVAVEAMDCGFVCSVAPVVEVDRKVRGRVSLADVPSLLGGRRPSVEVASRSAGPATPTAGSAAERIAALRQHAEGLRRAARFLVGAGSCGLAVGAGATLDRLTAECGRRGITAQVVAAGCNGMCFAAPVVEILKDGWPRLTASRVSAERVPALLDAVLDGRWPQDLTAVTWSEEPWQGLPPAASLPFFSRQRRLVLERCGVVDPADVADAIRHGSYAALARVLDGGDPEALIEQVQASGLQGRGGAYFSAAAKWRACRQTPGEPKFLVVNGEEGEPGIFKDRHLMEADPHRLLEGSLLAAFAAGASRGYLYVHGEADLAARRLERAVEEATRWGLIGERVLGTDFSCHLEIRRGAGGFILGEETALLESIEGKPAMPRVRPPFPVEAGLWGKPAVVNNVETLCAVPPIIAGGARASTKLFGLSGHVARPAIVEVELGNTLRRLIEEIGGGAPGGRALKAALVGGPSGVLVHPRRWDEPMLPRGTVDPGSGGIVALDDSASVADIVKTLLAFNAKESCGKCTPCREGTARMVEILNGASAAGGATRSLRELAEVVRVASLCGLGQAAPLSLLSALDEFASEVDLPR